MGTISEIAPHPHHINPPITDERAIRKCTSCKLVQFKTTSGLCRRCHKRLDYAELPFESPIDLAVCRKSDEGYAQPRVVRESLDGRVPLRMCALRESKHLSQRQVAERMKVPRTYISKIEIGGAVPSVKSCIRLANALEISLPEFIWRITGESDLLEDPICQTFLSLKADQRLQVMKKMADALMSAEKNGGLTPYLTLARKKAGN